MEPGPIAWRDIVEYADRAGLGRENTEALVAVITAMDAARRD